MVNTVIMIAQESIARRLGLKYLPVTTTSREYILLPSEKYNIEDEGSYASNMNAQDNSLANVSPIYATRDILNRLGVGLQKPHIYKDVLNRGTGRFTNIRILRELFLLLYTSDTLIVFMNDRRH